MINDESTTRPSPRGSPFSDSHNASFPAGGPSRRPVPPRRPVQVSAHPGVPLVQAVIGAYNIQHMYTGPLHSLRWRSPLTGGPPVQLHPSLSAVGSPDKNNPVETSSSSAIPNWSWPGDGGTAAASSALDAGGGGGKVKESMMSMGVRPPPENHTNLARGAVRWCRPQKDPSGILAPPR